MRPLQPTFFDFADKPVSSITFAGQALAQGPITLESVSGCAAVVSTTSVCPTCVTLQCIVQATVTAGCDSCPVTAVPTIYREYPCEGPCPDGCRTDYTVLTAEADMCGGEYLPDTKRLGVMT